VLQQRGLIRTIVNGVVQGTNLASLTAIVSASGSERGLLGFAFHPNYAKNGFVFVNYTDVSTGATKIARLTVSGSPPTTTTATLFPILTISQPFSNHNGGCIRFGQDGYLYVGMGDGGSGNDPGNRAQTMNNMLLGKFLRLDINGDDFPADATRNYAIPPTNPFNGVNGDREIWSCGVRNPWKFSFDNPNWLGTGGMVIGDVGQDAWEEIDFEPAGVGGRNYGWRVREGFATTGLGGGNSIPFTDPIHVYAHSGNSKSVTGGYVHRGLQSGQSFGRYFFAEYITGQVWSVALTYDMSGNATASNLIEHTAELSNTGALGNLSSIDVDSNGELFITSYSTGRILRVVPGNFAGLTGLTLGLAGKVEGGARHLLADDPHLFRAYPNLQMDSAAEENLTLPIVSYRTDNFAGANVNCQVRAATQVGISGTLKIQLYNFNTSRYETVSTHALTSTMTTFTAPAAAAANYREPGTGNIYMQLRLFQTAGAAYAPYDISFASVSVS